MKWKTTIFDIKFVHRYNVDIFVFKSRRVLRLHRVHILVCIYVIRFLYLFYPEKNFSWYNRY